MNKGAELGAEDIDQSSYVGMEYEDASPRADSMIESLRAFGYDLPTAIADLIDNSLSAKARNIWLDFFWDGEKSHIAIIDDGAGMNAETLLAAMRPGARSPLEPRSEADLGRFGLGLKTASFSQCRCLTVWSWNGKDEFAERRWDLDYVNATGEWRLLKTCSDKALSYQGMIEEAKHGTIIVLENLDRLVRNFARENKDHHDHFLRHIEDVEHHLSLVFHKYLEGPRAVRIHLNNRPIRPWDPFQTREVATQYLPPSRLLNNGQEIIVQPYVLPHHSKTEPERYSSAAGKHGWNAQQGFYVYRNRRLLVAGDWLGLGLQKEEHHKLARISIELTNAVDDDWKIDVKKSRAVPPSTLRKELRRIATLTRKQAAEIYRHRGARLRTDGEEIVSLWNKNLHHGKISYQINRDHPLISDILKVGGETARRVKLLLQLVEETIPVPTILIDSMEKPDALSKPFERDVPAVKLVLREAFESLIEGGQSPTEAKARLATLEPFTFFPELLDSLE